MMNVIVVGMMGEGKTVFIKSFIKDKKRFVFDVNNEYIDLPVDYRLPASRMIDLDHKIYIKRCMMKRDTCCVFEDATGFVEGRLSDDIRKVLVSKRHTRNVNIFVFHSILSIPPRLLQLSDYVIMFKTGDEDLPVEKR